MEYISFEQILPEFTAAANKMVWCNFATIDTKNRVRSRIVHPNWDNGIAWLWTRMNSPKMKHIAYSNYVSVAYVSDIANPVYAECTAAWVNDLVERQHAWDLIANTPEPLGYNIAAMYGSVDNPAFGLLKLTPWRLDVVHMPSTRMAWTAAQ